jgi:hypothetical protein
VFEDSHNDFKEPAKIPKEVLGNWWNMKGQQIIDVTTMNLAYKCHI